MRRLWLVALLLAAAPPAAAGLRATACGIGVPGERLAGRDADRDGVPDSEDWCMETPAGTAVGSSGCADWEVPARCERTVPPPPPATPAAPGPDADGDGVDDGADACPASPAGLEVDARGCVLIEKVVLGGVSFELGSAKLLPQAAELLRTVAAAMKANPRVEVEVRGHTDSIGEAGVNQRLSERRAAAVKAFLVAEGIGEARLAVRGYGESIPVASNRTDAGRSRNRRVEFKVVRE